MYIQLNTNDRIRGDERLQQRVEAEIAGVLSHYESQVTGVEVYLADTNANANGSSDKKCTIEVRPAGHRPIAVSHEAHTIEDALTAAAEKMQHRLEHELGRRKDHKGEPTIRKGGDAIV